MRTRVRPEASGGETASAGTAGAKCSVGVEGSAGAMGCSSCESTCVCDECEDEGSIAGGGAADSGMEEEES
jgi:hypothetical protein